MRARAGRKIIAGLVAVAIAFAALAASRAITAGPAMLTGAEWRAFGAREREAYVNGFLAGAAVGQIGAGAAPESSVSAVIQRSQSAHQLRFPYASNVYAARLDDYFVDPDHLHTPIVDALVRLNAQMLNPE